MEFFILKDHEVVSVGTLTDDISNLMLWGEWSAMTDRTVKKTWVGEVEISTVFIGVDGGLGCRCLFETIAFGTKKDVCLGKIILYQERYETWEEAVAGHRRVVRRIKSREKRKQPIQKGRPIQREQKRKEK